MKARIIVGGIEIRTEGLELSKRQVMDLLREAAGIAVLLSTSSSEEYSDASPIGFTAHLELDNTRNDLEDFSEWFEDRQAQT